MEWITRLRLELMRHGLKSVEVAHLIGRSEARISRLVRGWAEPTPEEICAISQALGIEESKIVGRVDPREIQIPS